MDDNESIDNNETANFISPSERLKVAIRIRPFLKEEVKNRKKRKHYLAVGEDQKHLYVMANNEDKEFQFDSILDMNADQLSTYETFGEPILTDILNGYNSTLIAYGQTGSGKTFTVFGSRYSIDTIGKSGPMLDDTGIVPRIVENLFDYIRMNPKNAQFRITTSFLQVYMEQITDLLSPVPFDNRGSISSRAGAGNKSLTIREDPKTGIFVHGLTLKKIRSKEELLNIIKRGARFRSTNSTTMNKTSSRSHAILQVFVEQRWVESADAMNDDLKQESGVRPTKKRRHRKALMTIVDLAGSERVSKSGSEGTRLAEAKTINKAISALGNCIVALSKNKTSNRSGYVPFRDSKLTRILTESLSGNSKTII
jgi:kinesin family protein 5